MYYMGIDLSKTASRLCIITGDGKLIERRIKITRAQFNRWPGSRAPARILVEALTESEWVAEGRG